MMTEKEFIEDLSQKNANYNNPEQAITVANLCDTISKDINTDSKRFIYELLQNADDASCLTGKLDVRIDFVDSYIVVSHKGQEFTQVDIESISSAGDGTKAGDENKTGFKGIGFKSVFHHSNCVYIKTGDYCFKYDKAHWNCHWNDSWDDKMTWRNGRKTKHKDAVLKMPWQIIPVWDELPSAVTKINLDGYNVSTVIEHNKISELEKELTDLFDESQIVLFLRSKDVTITINASEKILLEKVVNGEITQLKRGSAVLSEWLIKTEKFDIPEDVKNEIKNDEKSPRKLKESMRTEISFAIQLTENKLTAAKDALVFTFLPTSIKSGFPFLVNASFLTDAGRQHLHIDTYWNQWIYKKIPLLYFGWMARLADRSSRYNEQFIDVIPDKIYGQSKLSDSYNEGYTEALKSIAFIPNQNGDLLKVSDALLDATGISGCINKQTIVNHKNKTKGTSFTMTSFLLSNLEHKSVFKRLGVEVFEVSDLDVFFTSDIFVREHKLEENFRLIEFLFKQAQHENEDNRAEWDMQLKRTPFIFDDSEKLKKPEAIYFPSIGFTNQLADDISIIHSDVLVEINKDQNIKRWLERLGVKEPTDVSFIEKTIIGNSNFITIENAVEVCRYLFHAHKKGLLEDYYSKLRSINILTQQRTLKKAQDCFLSDLYRPELPLEQCCKIDFFVSDDYLDKNSYSSEWKTFFLKIEVKEDVEWRAFDIKISEITPSRIDYLLLNELKIKSQKFVKVKDNKDFAIGLSGEQMWPFDSSHITYKSFSFLQYADNYDFSRLLFQRIFDKFPRIPDNYNSIEVHGVTGLIYRTIDEYNLKRHDLVSDYFQWAIDNLAIFPTTMQKCLKSSEIFINTPENKELAGKYLPVLDYDGVLTDEWRRIVPFKSYLELDDYLKILSAISEESTTDEELIKENKERIVKIYAKIADNYLSDKDNLKTWGQTNKLMAKDDKFYKTEDLAYITVEGFNAPNLIYTNRPSDRVIKLFRLLGVKVIDRVSPEFDSEPSSSDCLKSKLLQVAPLIALVSIEKQGSTEWNKEHVATKEKIQQARFYETSGIELSYGNEEDKQKRSTFAENDKFYYAGQWDKTTVLDGLADPLCKFLHIKNAERLIVVLLSSSLKDGMAYLIEKGFDVTLILPELLTQPDTTVSPTPPPPEGIDMQSRVVTAQEAIKIVEEELKKRCFNFENANNSFTVTYGVIKPDGQSSKIITKSARGGWLYFTPREWIELADGIAQLFIVDSHSNVKLVSIDDIIERNDKFHIRFDTNVFAVDINLKIFAQFFKPMSPNSVYFVFEAPTGSTDDFLKEFGLSERNTSAVELTQDDINLLS
jgi:hypothetical protein